MSALGDLLRIFGFGPKGPPVYHKALPRDSC